MSNLGTFLSRAKNIITINVGAKKSLWQDVKSTYMYDANSESGNLGINEEDFFGRTAIMKASAALDFVAVKMLMDNGANIHLSDIQGKTILDYTLGLGNDTGISLVSDSPEQTKAELVALFLSKGVKVDVDTWVQSGKYEVNLEAIKLLAKTVNIHGVNEEGKNFFCYARDSALLWADQQNIDPNLVDNEGKNAYIQALENGSVHLASCLTSTKTDVNMADVNGKTPLMYAVETYDRTIVKRLLGIGSDVNAVDNKGMNALMHVITTIEVDLQESDNYSMCQLLKSHWSMDNKQRFGNSVEMAKVLVNAGADVLSKSEDGHTAYDRAIMVGDIALAEFLEKQMERRQEREQEKQDNHFELSV